MTHHFLLPCIPPTSMSQSKQISTRGARPVLHDSKNLMASKQTLLALMSVNRPHRPLTGPIKVKVTYTWPWLKGHGVKVKAKGRIVKTTKPDADNLAKLTIDCMAMMNFFANDAAVWKVTSEKYHGDSPGVRVWIVETDEDGEPI